MDGQERLCRDDRGGQAALHVAGAPPVYAAVADRPGVGVYGPAVAGLDHVDVRVEMHGRAGTAALEAGDHIGARVAVVVARRTFAAHILDGEAAAPEPLPQMFRAGQVRLSRRI